MSDLEQQNKILKEKADKWDKFSHEFIVTVEDGKTKIEPIINKELEQKNKILQEELIQLRFRIAELEDENKEMHIVLTFWTPDHQKEWDNLKSERDQLKSKIEKIIKDPYWKVHTGNLTHDSYVTYSQTELQIMIGQKFKELAKEILGE